MKEFIWNGQSAFTRYYHLVEDFADNKNAYHTICGKVFKDKKRYIAQKIIPITTDICPNCLKVLIKNYYTF